MKTSQKRVMKLLAAIEDRNVSRRGLSMVRDDLRDLLRNGDHRERSLISYRHRKRFEKLEEAINNSMMRRLHTAMQGRSGVSGIKVLVPPTRYFRKDEVCRRDQQLPRGDRD